MFVLKLKPGSEETFWANDHIRLRHDVGVRGHLVDQVCQSPDNPLDWLITGEWETLDHFLEWEKTQEHHDLAKHLRDCFAEAKSLKYVGREETAHGAPLVARRGR